MPKDRNTTSAAARSTETRGEPAYKRGSNGPRNHPDSRRSNYDSGRSSNNSPRSWSPHSKNGRSKSQTRPRGEEQAGEAPLPAWVENSMTEYQKRIEQLEEEKASWESAAPGEGTNEEGEDDAHHHEGCAVEILDQAMKFPTVLSSMPAPVMINPAELIQASAFTIHPAQIEEQSLDPGQPPLEFPMLREDLTHDTCKTNCKLTYVADLLYRKTMYLLTRKRDKRYQGKSTECHPTELIQALNNVLHFLSEMQKGALDKVLKVYQIVWLISSGEDWEAASKSFIRFRESAQGEYPVVVSFMTDDSSMPGYLRIKKSYGYGYIPEKDSNVSYIWKTTSTRLPGDGPALYRAIEEAQARPMERSQSSASTNPNSSKSDPLSQKKLNEEEEKLLLADDTDTMDVSPTSDTSIPPGIPSNQEAYSAMMSAKAARERTPHTPA